MSSNQSITLPINNVPTHIVVWQDLSQVNNIPVTQFQELKARIDTLESMVKQLVETQPVSRVRTVSDILGRPHWNSPYQQQMSKEAVIHSELSSICGDEEEKPTPKRSPFFTSTAVPEPLGLDVVHFNLPQETVETASVVEDTAEVFSAVVKALVPKQKEDKTVTLNGVTFAVHNWKNDVIYCDESTGRAFVDPQDAFDDPTTHSVGYWDSAKNMLIPSVKEDQQNEEEVVEEEEEVVEEEEEVVEEKEEVVEEEEEVVEEEEEVVEEEEEVVEEEEEVVEEEVVEEEVVEEEEAMELEEFEYKGQTYYKDGDNQVYQMVDGELDDTPIGVWNEQKQKVLKYPKSS
jgi:hypothetical protein